MKRGVMGLSIPLYRIRGSFVFLKFDFLYSLIFLQFPPYWWEIILMHDGKLENLISLPFFTSYSSNYCPNKRNKRNSISFLLLSTQFPQSKQRLRHFHKDSLKAFRKLDMHNIIVSKTVLKLFANKEDNNQVK